MIFTFRNGGGLDGFVKDGILYVGAVASGLIIPGIILRAVGGDYKVLHQLEDDSHLWLDRPGSVGLYAVSSLDGPSR